MNAPIRIPCSVEGCRGRAARWGRCQKHGAPPHVREEALQVYQRDGLQAACEAVGVSTGTILEWRAKAGVPLYSRRDDTALGLTGQEVADLAGVTYRQVDYWITHGFIDTEKPSPGSGRFRRFNPTEVEQIRTAARLVNAGIRLEHLKTLPAGERTRLLKVLEAEGFAA